MSTYRTDAAASDTPEATTAIVSISRIRLGDDRRLADATAIEQLASSLRETGQINPIIVRPVSGDGAHDWELVAGYLRLEALKLAGQSTVMVRVLSVTDEAATLVRIDENLFRLNLTAAETALALQQRKVIHDALFDDVARRAHIANRKLGRYHDVDVILAPTFAAQAAALTGASTRTVERAIARAAAIGVDELKRLAHTSLDTPTELDALAALAPAERKEMIGRAISGERISARRMQRDATRSTRTARGNSGTLERLQNAWDAAPVGEQSIFLARNSLARKHA